MARVEALEADVTKLKVDAIANAANTQLAHGGGVAGAIVRAGGDEIQRQSCELAPIGLGEAVATGAGRLPCRWVIHAATMHPGGRASEESVRAATDATLRVAGELGAESLALVAFGAGIGGLSVECAAAIETDAVRDHLAGPTALRRILFALRGAEALAAFRAALEAAPEAPRS